MAKNEQFKGAISIASNSPDTPTGYGQQARYLVDRFTRHGLKTAVFSNYGLEGMKGTLPTPYGKVAHYPKGFAPYSEDVIPLWQKEFLLENPDLKNIVLTLYDTWVYKNLKYDGPIYSWTPLDHVTLPPMVRSFLLRDNVSPITMSPHGKRQLDAAGIDNVYIPHGVDPGVFKPTAKIRGMKTRDFMKVPEDAFLVTMVSANKANKFIHRKALAENLMAFALFAQSRPDAYLYLHMEPSAVYGGFNLAVLLQAVGLDPEKVTIADPNQLRIGYKQEELAAFYTASDVLLAANYGEGFGIPVIESQMCGTPVITANWAATQDLAGETSWLVEGQPFWNEAQSSFFYVPLIDSITAALEQAYKAERGIDEKSIEFAKDFAVEKVWNESWLPLLRGIFGEPS